MHHVHSWGLDLQPACSSSAVLCRGRRLGLDIHVREGQGRGNGKVPSLRWDTTGQRAAAEAQPGRLE